MQLLPLPASDEQLLRVVDAWVGLLAEEDFEAAFAFIDQRPGNGWTADFLRQMIGSYGHVTAEGLPTDISQRKEVDWFAAERNGVLGQVWYDLNIDGYASDLTATFEIVADGGSVSLRLDDVHVM